MCLGPASRAEDRHHILYCRGQHSGALKSSWGQIFLKPYFMEVEGMRKLHNKQEQSIAHWVLLPRLWGWFSSLLPTCMRLTLVEKRECALRQLRVTERAIHTPAELLLPATRRPPGSLFHPPPPTPQLKEGSIDHVLSLPSYCALRKESAVAGRREK